MTPPAQKIRSPKGPPFEVVEKPVRVVITHFDSLEGFDLAIGLVFGDTGRIFTFLPCFIHLETENSW